MGTWKVRIDEKDRSRKFGGFKRWFSPISSLFLLSKARTSNDWSGSSRQPPWSKSARHNYGTSSLGTIRHEAWYIRHTLVSQHDTFYTFRIYFWLTKHGMLLFDKRCENFRLICKIFILCHIYCKYIYLLKIKYIFFN